MRACLYYSEILLSVLTRKTIPIDSVVVLEKVLVLDDPR